MSSDFPRNIPICQFFAQKQCKRGRYCRFLHVIDISAEKAKRENAVAVSESQLCGVREADTEKKPLGGNQPSKNEEKPSIKKRCREFFGSGSCRFGENCKFSHGDVSIEEPKLSQRRNRNRNRDKDVRQPEQGLCHDDAIQPLQDAAGSDGDTEHKEDSIPSGTLKPAKRKPCRFFRAGYCRLGSRCNFLHLPSPGNGMARGGRGGALRGKNEAGVKSSVADGDAAVGEETRDVAAGGHFKRSLPAARQPEALTRVEARQPLFADAAAARKNELEQVRKRFPGATETVAEDGRVTVKFVFSPSDPDWPYDVKAINIEATFPIDYPTEMLSVQLSDDGQMPDTVRRMVSESLQDWVQARHGSLQAVTSQHHQAMTSQHHSTGHTVQFDLAFRPLLKWFDKQAEEIFTAALKQLRREKMAEAAGLQFIPASQLRKVYSVAEETPLPNPSSTTFDTAPDISAGMIPPGNKDSDSLASDQPYRDPSPSDVCSSDKANSPEPEEKLEGLDVTAAQPTAAGTTGRIQPARCGTEVTLQSLALGEGVATLQATRVTFVLACGRCSQTCEIATPPGRTNALTCAYCHAQMLVRLNACVAYAMSNVIGYADLEGCAAVDMVMTSSVFGVVCMGCDREMKIESLAAGQLNTCWCLHCHQKLTVSANSVRFVKLAAPSTAQCDVSGACVVETKRLVRAVRDPLIQEGKPLPDCGTCRHYKKSFRWLRFPCCGKAYPCDVCHEERESHEMKFANRMICGYCAKEQPYSKEGPCSGCQASMTNKSTAHWEGGTGCRDKIKMSRNDSKKYANAAKTISRSADIKTDPSKKITRLRHAD